MADHTMSPYRDATVGSLSVSHNKIKNGTKLKGIFTNV